ncbi:MAG: replicative DNA helicase [Bdellovibrionales bacterium]|nr:replicative DNA helicase [Bdellovibrionales bacterium]
MGHPLKRVESSGTGQGSRSQSDGKATTGSRIPPNTLEAEESVIGAILLDNNSIDMVLERITADDFYQPRYRVVFECMRELHEKGQPIDVITLGQILRSKQELENVGGLEELSRLAASVPSSAHIAYYAKMLKEMSIRRRIIHETAEISREAFDLGENIETFLDTAEQRILGVSDFRARPAFHRVGEVVQSSISIIEELYHRKEPITGTPSGFTKLDRLTAGFQPSDLIIIAARPSMGKTAFALSISQFVGVQANMPVALFSLEMSKEQLVMRMLCGVGRVDSSRVRTGNLQEHDFPKLVDAASRIAEAGIYIDDTPAMTVTELRAKCRRLHRDQKLGLIMVDYLQLMRSPAYASSREQEISDISRSLKALAKELNVPVVALSQLNRSLENRTDKRPIMSDLRESGAIEQDADLIMFIYRDEVYHEETEDKGVAEIIISKQRNGPTGVVRLAFLPEYTLFANLDEREEDDLIEQSLDLSGLDDDIF